MLLLVGAIHLRGVVMKRCSWCGDDDIYVKYHDEEWGVPLHGDRELFEFLCLEGAQAGLSWITILKKRAGYKKAFKDFDILKCSKLTDKRLEKLLDDTSIVRNRLKVYSVRTNAIAALKVIEEFGSLDQYFWSFVNFKTKKNKFKSLSEVPAKTEVAEVLSKDLKKRGFKFVGPTIVYAFMQATGMVNDHFTSCFRYKEV